MATCKECARWKLCQAGGTTIYYGKDLAAGNVENLCSRFAPKERKEEKVNHPSHYQGKNECIDVMVAMFGKEAVKHFCMCNAYKYRFRSDKKNGDEDIKKAEWYETKLIELGGVDES